jgi:hypothetical protein
MESRGEGSGRGSRAAQVKRRSRARRVTRAGAVCALAVIALAGSPASAQDPPALLSVTVVGPTSVGVPPPTGKITLSVNDRTLATVPLLALTNPLTALTPQIAAAVAALGQNVTLSYSGDSNYEAVDGVIVSTLTRRVISITTRPKDSAAPSIDISAPGDGVRYEVGESVAAIYSCADPGGRSAVRTCEGPVASGTAIDTATAGRHSFTVRTADALGNAATKSVDFQVGAPAPPPPPAPTGDSSSPAPAPAATPATPAAPATPATPAMPAAGALTAAVAPPAAATLTADPRQSLPTSGSSVPGSGGGGPPATSPAPADSVKAQPVAREFAPYDPRSEPVKTMGILVAAFTLLQIGMAGGGLAGSGGGVVRSRSGSAGTKNVDASAPESGFDYEGVRVRHLGAGVAAFGLGDRSRTWSWPGTRAVDALGAAIPARLSPRSPLLARVLADGTYLRAIFGSASLLALLGGLALGVLAVVDTGGEAIPPVALLTISIAVLGVLDATAGFAAVLIFAVGVLVLGGVDTNAHLRLMLGLGALWFVVPVLAGAVRPLRREPVRNLEESWERAADFVIASLIGAWAVQKMVLALPGLAGVEFPLTEYANEAAYFVLAALVVRLGLESLAAHLYPRRLDVAEPRELPAPSPLQRLGATALRVAVFVFFANIAVGSSWQLWVGAALFVIPQILAVFKERFPNSPVLFRALPKGLVELVLMLFIGTATAALLISTMDENAATFIANSFVLLALPGFVLSLLKLFGRDGAQPEIGWGRRIAGVPLLLLGILLVLGLLL